MNSSQKCNCCLCEQVCKYKEIYLNGIKQILNVTISAEDEKGSFWKLKDCPHIEVSIKCPHIVAKSNLRGVCE